jgi:hypothetical protein
MRRTTNLLIAALAAVVAWSAPADAQRGGSMGGKPVAAYPGAKPGAPAWGHGSGNWQGRGDWHGRGDGYWRGHGDGWRGGYRGPRYYHYPYYPAYSRWSLGIGFGLGYAWPSWGWDPYWYGYPYYRSGPVAIVDGPVYVNPEPMPAYGEPAFRWYCPSANGYYPDVRECDRDWLKVVPGDRGPAPPPVSGRSGTALPPPASSQTPGIPIPPPASSQLPRSSTPDVETPRASSHDGVVRTRIAAPRLASPMALAAGHGTPVLADNRAQ